MWSHKFKRKLEDSVLCCFFLSAQRCNHILSGMKAVPPATQPLQHNLTHSLFREACQNKHPACVDLCLWWRMSTEPQLKKKEKRNAICLCASSFSLCCWDQWNRRVELMNPYHVHTCMAGHACEAGRSQCDLISGPIKTSLSFNFCMLNVSDVGCLVQNYISHKLIPSQKNSHFCH